MKNIFWYVQSSIGIGHIVRSLNIIKKLSNCKIMIVTGGIPCAIENYPHITHVNLPGIIMNSNMELEPMSTGIDLDVVKAKRKTIIRNYFSTCNFDMIVTEQFPFGGHSLKEELFELFRLNQKKSKLSTVVASVRDILSPDMSGEERDPKTLTYIQKYYDKILVHSDETILPLSKTFQSCDKIKHLIRYTGYVTQDYSKINQLQSKDPYPTIVFGMGGSDRGFNFLDRVLVASETLSSQIKHKLIVFVGKLCETKKIQYQIKASHLPHVTVLDFSPSFLNYLASASLYVGLAGYNTTMDLLHFGIPGIIYPYTERHEPDLRLRTLNKNHQWDILDRSTYGIDTLVQLMTQRLNSQQRYLNEINLNGADISAQHIHSLLGV